jgi:ABC-type transporter Mla subunit MlaD
VVNERTLRIRIGLFVLAALVLLGTLILMFGSLPSYLKGGTPYWVRFTDAPGVGPGTPVRRSGVRIGEVRQVILDEERGIVRVQVVLNPPYRLRRDEQATVVVGLLGSDAAIDFIPVPPEAGQPADHTPLEPGAEVVGVRQASVSTLLTRATAVVPTTQETLDEMRKSLQRLERMSPLAEETMREYRDLARSARQMIPDLRRTNDEYRELARAARDAIPDLRRTNDEVRQLVQSARETIPELRRTNEDIGATARNWGRLGERLDVLLQANQDKLVRTLDSLNDTLTRTANVLNDENQRNLAVTLRNVSSASQNLGSISRSTDDVLQQGRTTVRRLNEALEQTNHVLSDLQKTTRPLGERGEGMIRNLDESLANTRKITTPLADRSERTARNLDEALERLNATLGDVRALMRVLDQSDGTLRRLLTDPSLYNHLDEAACMVKALVPRVDLILRDFEVFADKLARHPESLGLGGLVRPSSGLKDPPTPPGFYPH